LGRCAGRYKSRGWEWIRGATTEWESRRQQEDAGAKLDSIHSLHKDRKILRKKTLIIFRDGRMFKRDIQNLKSAMSSKLLLHSGGVSRAKTNRDWKCSHLKVSLSDLTGRFEQIRQRGSQNWG
jgi:hypothetical protein